MNAIAAEQIDHLLLLQHEFGRECVHHAFVRVAPGRQSRGGRGEFGIFEEHDDQSMLLGNAPEVGQLPAEGVFGEEVGEEHHQCVAWRPCCEDRGQL